MVRWTCRAMAREFGVSKATVQRVWSQNEVKPHLTRVFKLSSDPDFEAKFWDVIGRRRMDRAMNTNSRDSHNKPGRPADLAAREIRACSVCGAKFSATRNSEFCPMCMLRQALPDAVESVEPPFEDTVTLTERFEHYEVVKDEHGDPIELGRGAMGITYKAFDVVLQYAVTLKVISERYLGDESARLRFLREARAAASVRHPNVASVFHLG